LPLVRHASELGYTYLSIKNTPERLRFPRGVRLARREDIPKCTDEILRAIADADIRTGFLAKSTSDTGYSTYLEANVHAENVWKVFESLVMRLLPSFAAPLIAHKDDDPTFGPCTQTSAALSTFLPYVESLQHDGFIEFGMIYRRAGITEEVLVASTKHFKIWTNHGDAAQASLVELGLGKVDTLSFIDEYPRVTETIVGAPAANTVVSAIVESFAALPSAEKPPH
jgi:hypothetical protein